MKSPYANCEFSICDLPGQCLSEGRCHHPRKCTLNCRSTEDCEEAGYPCRKETEMDIADRKREVKAEVEKAFWEGATIGGGKGQAFGKVIDYIVELEARVEALERKLK